jgi:chromosome partitioning protein
MITVVGGIKGGGGKTTVATHLCVMRSASGKKVLLVDADEQRTASQWVSQRKALNIETEWTTILLAGEDIHHEIRKLAEHYDDIIIDIGGRDTTSQRSALSVADICIVPFKPKSFDMWTLGAVKKMIGEIKPYNTKLVTYLVLNQAECRGSDNQDAIEMMKEFSNFICIPSTIGYRKSFGNAAADGISVIELKKQDQKATEEIKDLYKFIYGAYAE